MDNRIRVLREARGLSLEALATTVETSNQQISLLEAGKRRLTVDWLLRLSQALACHPWELVVEADLPHPLSARHIHLLDQFNGLTEPQQEAVLQLLATFASQERQRRRAALE